MTRSPEEPTSQDSLDGESAGRAFPEPVAQGDHPATEDGGHGPVEGPPFEDEYEPL